MLNGRLLTSGPPGFAATGITGEPANLVFSNVFNNLFVIYGTKN